MSKISNRSEFRPAIWSRAAAGALIALGVLAGSIGPGEARTTTKEAVAFLDSLIEKGEAILVSAAPDETKKSRLRTMFAERFHVEAVGRFVLGRHLGSLDDDQLASYYPVFREYVLATFFGRVADLANYTISITGAESYGDRDVLVRSVAAFTDGDEVDIGWRIRDGDDGFQIIDMLLEGVSLAVTQRSDFRAVLAEDGLDGLIAAMRGKIDNAD